MENFNSIFTGVESASTYALQQNHMVSTRNSWVWANNEHTSSHHQTTNQISSSGTQDADQTAEDGNESSPPSVCQSCGLTIDDNIFFLSMRPNLLKLHLKCLKCQECGKPYGEQETFMEDQNLTLCKGTGAKILNSS